jgi:non-specific protein-tyrosine kinase
MKLRKALDKAKQAHASMNTLEDIEPAATVALPSDRFQPDDHGNTHEWVPPVYTQSRTDELDLNLLEKNRCVGLLPDAPEIDAYKVLRTQIQHRAQEKGMKTIMITSAQSNEGKTLTAVNLSLTFAKAFGQTVLLVDGDLKQQSVHRLLGVEGKRGLADYLMDDMPLKDLIVWPGVDKFTLISGGRSIQDSTELLGSPKMKALVQEMKTRYADRYVFFDVPPLLQRADAGAFAPFVDGIVMVVEEGKTSLQHVKQALELIPGEKFIGFVLNRQKI